MEMKQYKFEGIFKVGLILNIVFGAIMSVLMGVYTIITIIGASAAPLLLINLLFFAPWFAGSIVTLIISVKAFRAKDTSRRVTLGVLGIIFTGIIGGILVLCAEQNDTTKIVNDEMELQNLKLQQEILKQELKNANNNTGTKNPNDTQVINLANVEKESYANAATSVKPIVKPSTTKTTAVKTTSTKKPSTKK